ncbi:MAG: GTPase HflX [Acidobacteriota bacterium]
MHPDQVSVPERVAIVGLVSPHGRRVDPDLGLRELEGLVAAAGGQVVLRSWQERATPDAATYVGRGKLDEVALACAELDVDVVVFDAELSASQQRQVEGIVGRRAVDRTELILDIFARRAQTREGKLQVELAQLRYLLPRLVGAGVALSRLGGGIGTRGPGETKLETDRRRIRRRIASISDNIDEVRRRRARLRERRQKADMPTIALVGYTNAGKSTLFNLLTDESADTSDALFVTLDPLVRRVRLGDGRDLLISDTVGFIDRLPHALVAAFRATLEEVCEADLLVHVVDGAEPDYERRMDAVQKVLEDVGAADVPRIDAFNKCDRLTPAERERLAHRHPASVLVSALRGEGRDALLANVIARVGLDTERVRITMNTRREEGRQAVVRLYRHARVVNHLASGGRVEIVADVPRRMLLTLGRAAVRIQPGRGGNA